MNNLASNEIPRKKKRTVSIFREYFELISETLIFVFFVMTFLLQSFVIPTGSMEDTLLIGDHLFVDKVSYSRFIGGVDHFFLPQTPIKRGMVVTFKPPHELDKEYVKRVIGLPGESIQIIDKKVYINGHLISEPYVYFKGGMSIDNFPPQTDTFWYSDYFRNIHFPFSLRQSLVETPYGKAFQIPKGYYFCMGDNRDDSFDSRFWGPVPMEYIVGKPWRIYWSYLSSRDEYLRPGIVSKVKDLAKTFVHFISKTRWKRTLTKIR